MLGWQAMNHADLDQLLILQEKDVRISKLRKELASLPEQRTRLLRQMEAIKQKALAAKQEVASVEKSIRDVEAAVETKRAYVGKMKTLQSNTRKNEEYQMCIQEVEKTEAAIDALETSELELMERLEAAKTDMEQKIRRARDAQREMEETLARFGPDGGNGQGASGPLECGTRGPGRRRSGGFPGGIRTDDQKQGSPGHCADG